MFFGPGWTQPTHFGLVRLVHPNEQWRVNSLSTAHAEQWRQCSEEEEKEEERRGADLRWLRGGAAGGC